MRLRLMVFMLASLLVFAANAQRNRAFMVGISHYDTALTGYQWNDINGVEDVSILTPILKKQGFYLSTVLDKEATYDNIVKKLKRFVSETKKGDLVYIHFSTHGQPVEDMNGDETDGWDEAIVPIDAYKIYKKGVYEGEKHLLDDQLGDFVQQLRNKIGPKGFLYVVIDACHAGTSSRGNDDIVRGTRIGFTKNSKVFKPSKDKKFHYSIKKSDKYSNVMFLEACRSDQVNTEIMADGKRYGPLSYNIAQTLSSQSLSRDADDFLVNLKASIMKSGKWPNNQNIVIESSL